ncbi:putative integral membrane protein [Vibrio diabolicus E0666]|nr:putative integral membrane protein [Vibrio diabolicus E0666]
MPHHNVQQQARMSWVKLPTNYSVLVVLATVLLIVIATIGGKIFTLEGITTSFLMEQMSSYLRLMKFRLPLQNLTVLLWS